MTRETANELAAYFRSLCPRMTNEQMAAVRNLILPLDDPGRVKTLLFANACAYENFSLAQIAGALKAIAYADPLTPAERTARELARERQTEQAIEAEWRAIDAVIGALTDEELKAVKAAAIDEAPPEMRARLAAADPRNKNRRLLRGLMAKVINEGNSCPTNQQNSTIGPQSSLPALVA